VLATAKPGKLQITKSPATGRTLSCENVEKGGNWNDREESNCPPGHCPPNPIGRNLTYQVGDPGAH